jgi:hypothetical protein
MNSIPNTELDDLLRKRDWPSLSIFMPTYRAGVEIEQNRIRLKNLLADAENRLLRAEVRSPEIRSLLTPAHDLVEDDDFWQQQRDGLALYIAPDWFREYRLPIAVEELLVLGRRFHVKPLLSLFSIDGRFYILALSQSEVRLFRCAQYTIEEVGLEDVPGGVQNALRYDDPERQLQYHTQTNSPVGSEDRAASFHGHGVGEEEDKKERILRYFQKVDQGISKLLAEENAPLVLAGVEYLHPLYREANQYPHLEEEGVRAQLDETGLEELHARGWETARPTLSSERQRLAKRYRDLASGERASNDVGQILPAALQGRIHGLLVARDEHLWGSFDPDSNRVTCHEGPEQSHEDLLDRAAIETLQRGGKVYIVEAEKVPGKGKLAAVFRY